MVPTLPGSWTPSSTTSGQPAERAAARHSAGDDSGAAATASTPCGVTVWLRLRKRPRASVTRPAAGASKASPSRTASSCRWTPAATASATTRGPSRRARPGGRRLARRRSFLATSLSGLVIGRSEAVLGNLHQPGKGAAVAHGQVGQHLAVDLYSGLAKAVHESVVGQPGLPGRRVDARDPELPHLPLPAPAVAEGVGEGVQHRLVGGPEEKLLGEPEALGPLQDRAVPAVGGDSAL